MTDVARTGRPYVVAHVAISLDGSTTGFEPDLGSFYRLIETWKEDVTLTGADTILAQEEALRASEPRGPAEDGPVLAVVDSRGRVREWEALRTAGHWSDVLALRAEITPPRTDDIASTSSSPGPSGSIWTPRFGCSPGYRGARSTGDELELDAAQMVGAGLVWLRYRVRRWTSSSASRSISRPSCQEPSSSRSYSRMMPTGRKPTFS